MPCNLSNSFLAQLSWQTIKNKKIDFWDLKNLKNIDFGSIY
jgi:hypothetical protein